MRDINSIIRNVVKPITKNFSPVLLILIRNWRNIMGEKYYEFCEVEKVSFPKGKKNEGTIYINAFNNVISFYIENNKFFILDKINSIFGYGLISNIKIRQTPKIIKQRSSNDIKLSDSDEKIVNNSVVNIDNNELKNSLKSLGEAIFIKK